jgi:hypothetical protein
VSCKELFEVLERTWFDSYMNGHHLILGRLTDFITGKEIEDTHDERYRQEIARLLVEQKDFVKSDIIYGQRLNITAGDKSADIKIDFLVKTKDKTVMMVKYGPGSLVTRHRPALAASRLVAPYQVPVVVVTNGEDADILEGSSGAVMSKGLLSIPSRKALIRRCGRMPFEGLSAKRLEVESRILYAYEVCGTCHC